MSLPPMAVSVQQSLPEEKEKIFKSVLSMVTTHAENFAKEKGLSINFDNTNLLKNNSLYTITLEKGDKKISFFTTVYGECFIQTSEEVDVEELLKRYDLAFTPRKLESENSSYTYKFYLPDPESKKEGFMMDIHTCIQLFFFPDPVWDTILWGNF